MVYYLAEASCSDEMAQFFYASHPLTFLHLFMHALANYQLFDQHSVMVSLSFLNLCLGGVPAITEE